jgi:hypothetical protein
MSPRKTGGKRARKGPAGLVHLGEGYLFVSAEALCRPWSRTFRVGLGALVALAVRS